jgi:hypothetical protein
MNLTSTRAATIAVACIAALAGGCSWFAVATAPDKVAQSTGARGGAVAAQFWEAFHGGSYERIDELLEQHAQVLVTAPGDALTTAHKGWLHAWRLAERARAAPSARITEHATLARALFDDAAHLMPEDARILGFAAGFTMTEAGISGDQKELRRGYYRMKDAVAAFPEFNLFTSGYTMSGAASDSAAFREGLEQQWATLDVCFGERVARDSPRLDKYLPLRTSEGPKRVCWNSWIAPHNWEGFFLNFGDMLARANDLPNARAMYEAARLSDSYSQWPWRDVLERRLAHLQELPERLNHPARDEREWTPMVKSVFACTGCHQASGTSALRADASGAAR